MLKKTLTNASLSAQFILISPLSAHFSDESQLKTETFKVHLVNSDQAYQQWFTGPLLSLTPITVEPTHPSIEPSICFTKQYGIYDKNGKIQKRNSIWSLQPFIDFQVGINRFIAIEVLASSSTNFCKEASSTHLNDTSVFLGFQISSDKKRSWIPDFRILFQEIFPTGKYKKLNPKKHFTDLTGQGAFSTGVNFVTQKLFEFKNGHNLTLEFGLGYLIPSSVHAKGINYFGGNPQTNTKVYPGDFLNGYFATQYSLNRTWGVTLEALSTIGRKGKISKHKLNTDLSLPSYYQFSLAPEIQHTVSPNLGFIMGGWFTLFGQNTTAFAQLFVAALYIF